MDRLRHYLVILLAVGILCFIAFGIPVLSISALVSLYFVGLVVSLWMFREHLFDWNFDVYWVCLTWFIWGAAMLFVEIDNRIGILMGEDRA